jgi:hypothetical protein
MTTSTLSVLLCLGRASDPGCSIPCVVSCHSPGSARLWLLSNQRLTLPEVQPFPSRILETQ